MTRFELGRLSNPLAAMGDAAVVRRVAAILALLLFTTGLLVSRLHPGEPVGEGLTFAGTLGLATWFTLSGPVQSIIGRGAAWVAGKAHWLVHQPITDPDPRDPTAAHTVHWIMLAIASIVIGSTVGETLLGRLLVCCGALVLIGLAWARLGTALAPVRGLILIVIFYHLILQQDQSVETIRTTNESPIWMKFGGYAAWGYACAFLGIMLHALAKDVGGEPLRPGERPSHWWVPPALFAAPLLSAAYTCWEAGDYGAIPCLFMAMCTAFAALAVLEARFRFIQFTTPAVDGPADIAFSVGVLAIMAVQLPFLVGSLGFSLEPPPAALMAGWLTLVAAAITLISRFSLLKRAPVGTLILAWAALLSWFDLNDNHEIAFRWTRSGPPPSAGRSFDAWLKSPQRRDNATAFIVVAEGGGARAGYMTALALEALRMQCSAFRRHHFATIGVSGGSVGAALSAAAPPLPPAGSDCRVMARFGATRSPAVYAMGSDLLGPTLRGFLFADLPMRLFPSSFWRMPRIDRLGVVHRPSGDRTAYLEARLGLGWAEQQGLTLQDRLRLGGLMADARPQFVDRSFAAAWSGPTGDRPALILLATDVASGRRLAASHLRFGPAIAARGEACLKPRAIATASLPVRNRLLTLADVAPGRDPTLLAAALMSARFPVITPAATLPCPNAQWRAVDGGYFENSGLTTALELVKAMVGGVHGPPPRVVIVRIENGEATTRFERTSSTPSGAVSTSFPELLSPPRALGGTREARADQARQAMDDAAAHGLLLQARLRLKHCHVAIPLGWSLSDAAKADVRQQLGLEPTGDPCVREAAKANLMAFARIMTLAAEPVSNVSRGVPTATLPPPSAAPR